MYNTRLLHPLLANFMFGYLFYCIPCVLIVETCHIVLPRGFLLPVYYRFYRCILLVFLKVATLILMFYYHFNFC